MAILLGDDDIFDPFVGCTLPSSIFLRLPDGLRHGSAEAVASNNLSVGEGCRAQAD
jgi:hypothetical protein